MLIACIALGLSLQRTAIKTPEKCCKGSEMLSTSTNIFISWLNEKMNGENWDISSYFIPQKQHTVKPVLKGHLKIDTTKTLMTNGSLMKVESIAECSPWSILQYF